MLKFAGFLIPVFLIVCTSVYVFAWCERPTAWGIDWSATPDESLCDASIGTSTENPDADIKTFVCSESVDHYSGSDLNLHESGFYSMNVSAIYSRIIDIIPIRQEASDSDASYYVGGCSESVAAKIHYDDPDLAQFFHGEGEVDIWGSRQTYDSANFRRYVYDHDEDILDPLGMI